MFSVDKLRKFGFKGRNSSVLSVARNFPALNIDASCKRSALLIAICFSFAFGYYTAVLRKEECSGIDSRSR